MRQIFDHVAKSIHFHLLIFINVAETIFILTNFYFDNFYFIFYLTLFRNFLCNNKFHMQFDSKCFIFLWLASYQFSSMSSKLGGMCRSREVDSPANSFSNSCQISSIDEFFARKYLAFSNK